ncbi:MAG: ATP-binding cassette domain-containing protein [Aerococcus sp.]|nr:ATP-binding cassette domain-containing protein [Aerococcus sp.]
MGVIDLKNLKVYFPIRGGFFNTVQDWVYAVDDVTMSIEAGKTYGLIGESGSGKTTIGRAIVGLEHVTGGQILYNGQDVTGHARGRQGLMKEYNRSVQMIFQDSASALNPKKRIYDVIKEPIVNYADEKLSEPKIKKRIIELLEIVGLNEGSLYKYPHEFSGGQRQRIGVARAVASNPKLIIADEPTSALDVSVQAQVLNFMKQIQNEYNISYLFISHDLGVVEHMADDIAIMHRGRFVEQGVRREIFDHPLHIYTKRLLAAIPQVDPHMRQTVIERQQAVIQENERDHALYYDENDRAFDLTHLSEEHWVALDPNKDWGNL